MVPAQVVFGQIDLQMSQTIRVSLKLVRSSILEPSVHKEATTYV